MADVRMGHFFIGRLGPRPVLRRKERTHGVDVAVIRRSLNEPLVGRFQSNHLHEQCPNTALGSEPLLKLPGVFHPTVRMKRAQAGLLVNGIKRLVRLIRQDICLQDLSHQAFGR